jgi:hypothetical protein
VPIDGHEYGHGKGVNGLTAEECFVKVRQYHCGLIARLAARLQAVREGAGTLLDHTLIVYLSDSGEAHHPHLREWPVVLLGGLGSRLRPGGRYLQMPGYGKPGHRTLANLYLTFLHAVGAPRDRFGLLDNALRDLDPRGPLPELLA